MNEQIDEATYAELWGLVEHNRCPTKLEVDRFIRSLGYRLIPDRPELREKIAEIVTPPIKNYVLGYIHNLNQLEVELKRNVDFMVDQLLSLFPPLTLIGDVELKLAEGVNPNDIVREVEVAIENSKDWELFSMWL